METKGVGTGHGPKQGAGGSCNGTWGKGQHGLEVG